MTKQENLRLREDSLQWFFEKNEVERIALKEKYFTDDYIEYSSQWGFHFTLGQIGDMYAQEIASADRDGLALTTPEE